jgi:hypothetical protein
MQQIQQGDEQVGYADEKKVGVADIALWVPGYNEDGKGNNDTEGFCQGMEK